MAIINRINSMGVKLPAKMLSMVPSKTAIQKLLRQNMNPESMAYKILLERFDFALRSRVVREPISIITVKIITLRRKLNEKIEGSVMSIDNWLNDKQNIATIISPIPIISGALMLSWRSLREPIIKIIIPVASSPGIKAGPIRNCPPKDKSVVMTILQINPNSQRGFFRRWRPTFFPSGNLFRAFFSRTIPKLLNTPDDSPMTIPSQ